MAAALLWFFVPAATASLPDVAHAVAVSLFDAIAVGYIMRVDATAMGCILLCDIMVAIIVARL